MLDKPTTLPRARLDATARDVLAVLPAIGKLMVTARHLGATHERIGTVETVSFEGGWAVIGGAEHESRIELAGVAEIIVDRTSAMKDKAYPRIDLHRPDGSYICGIVGFDGIEPFDAAVAPLGVGTAVDEKPDTPPGERVEATETDPGRLPLEDAQAAGTPVVIGFRRPGFQQFWRGTIDAVKPAMGFINVMRADFHLHLKAGAVAEWHHDSLTGEREAFNADGEPLGLSLLRAN
jgi:putative heme degradation protein